MSYTPLRDRPIFEKKGNLLIPTVLAKGPWHANSLHGSSMMGLIARAAEQYPSDIPRLISRVTVDMMRAAPMTPLTTEVELVRSGKNVEFLDIRLLSEGELYVRATAMRIRQANVEVDDYFRDADNNPTAPDRNKHNIMNWPGAAEPAYPHSVDLYLDEHKGEPILWSRLAVPFVEGEENSSIVQVAAACDWTYAVPSMWYIYKNRTEEEIKNNQPPTKEINPQQFSAINPDTTINFFRPHQGEWLGIKAQAAYGDQGSGCCSAQLFDELGPIGFSSQSILIRSIK